MVTHNRGVTPRAEPLYAHIVGWGMAVPDKILTNADLAAIVETSDEWIRSRTGIRERHIAGEQDTTATLGLKAAQRALEVADILPTDIDMIIVATSTPEHIFPSTASLIQSWLGATKAGAFDLSAACSGFVYALDMAAQSIRSGRSRTAVVIGSETMSRVLDWQDRGTCVIFGDGAGAVVLTGSNIEGGVLSAVLRSDGSGGDLLGIPTVGSIDIGDFPVMANGYKYGKMHMNGAEVFKFATRVIGESINQALDIAGLTIKDLKLIVPHQANQRIIQAAARALKVDESMFVSNIERYGNTSSASIPIALCEAIAQGRILPNDYIAFVGFGGGLTWASMIIQWGAPAVEERAVISFNRQRRQVSYQVAWLRARMSRLNHQVNEVFRRIRPQRGRIDRLRHRMDQHDFQ